MNRSVLLLTFTVSLSAGAGEGLPDNDKDIGEVYEIQNYKKLRRRRTEQISVSIGSVESFEELEKIEKTNENLWNRFDQLIKNNEDLRNLTENVMAQNNKNLSMLFSEDELEEVNTKNYDLMESLEKLWAKWEESGRSLNINQVLLEENKIIKQYNFYTRRENSILASALPVSEFEFSSRSVSFSR